MSPLPPVRVLPGADVSDEAVTGDGSVVRHLARVREAALPGRGCVVGRGAPLGARAVRVAPVTVGRRGVVEAGRNGRLEEDGHP